MDFLDKNWCYWTVCVNLPEKALCFIKAKVCLVATFSLALTQPDTVEWWMPNFLAVSLKVWSRAYFLTSSLSLLSDSSPSRRCRAITVNFLIGCSDSFGIPVTISASGSKFSFKLEAGEPDELLQFSLPLAKSCNQKSRSKQTSENCCYSVGRWKRKLPSINPPETKTFFLPSRYKSNE